MTMRDSKPPIPFVVNFKKRLDAILQCAGKDFFSQFCALLKEYDSCFPIYCDEHSFNTLLKRLETLPPEQKQLLWHDGKLLDSSNDGSGLSPDLSGKLRMLKLVGKEVEFGLQQNWDKAYRALLMQGPVDFFGYLQDLYTVGSLSMYSARDRANKFVYILFKKHPVEGDQLWQELIPKGEPRDLLFLLSGQAARCDVQDFADFIRGLPKRLPEWAYGKESGHLWLAEVLEYLVKPYLRSSFMHALGSEFLNELTEQERKAVKDVLGDDWAMKFFKPEPSKVRPSV